MKLITDSLSILTISGILGTIVYVVQTWPFADMTRGVLRCEKAGAIVLNVGGRDYAVNGKASNYYPPVQRVWSNTSHPETDIDRLIVQGLTLCDWEENELSSLTKARNN